ncbi:glutaredoxin [Striga asiatica]|uniref:Glutaredoxin n=1 Tax=Striga asiatica TaxID=4170 RepID=A0A5A7QVS0_STRAF|nr:glutaredoxin [Striga asiatica]
MALAKAKEIVSTNPVVVFSKTYCPFCTSVKDLLTKLGATFKAIELNTESDLDRLWLESSPDPLVAHRFGNNLLNFEYDGLASDGSELQAALFEWTGQRTVPNVFIGGKHIGGCDATTNLHNQGKLVPMLTEAKALTAEASA